MPRIKRCKFLSGTILFRLEASFFIGTKAEAT